MLPVGVDILSLHDNWRAWPAHGGAVMYNLLKHIARLKRSNSDLEYHVKELLLNYEFREYCEKKGSCIDFEGLRDAMIECNVARVLVSEAEVEYINRTNYEFPKMDDILRRDVNGSNKQRD